MFSQENVEDSIRDGYDFDLGRAFSGGWRIFISAIGSFIGYNLIVFVIMIVVSIVLAFIPIVGQFGVNILVALFILGFPIVGNRINTNSNYDFESFFDGFKKMGGITLVVLLKLVLSLLIIIPMYFLLGWDILGTILKGSTIEPEVFMSKLVWFIPIVILSFYFYLTTRWAEWLAYFFDYNPMDALKKSIQLINKQIVFHILYIILFFVIFIAACLPFLLGLIFVVPLYQLVEYQLFEDATKMLEDMESDKFNLYRDDIL